MERDFLRHLDYSGRYTYVGAQPLRIYFQENGVSRRYTPDFLCKFQAPPNTKPLSPILVEVKPLEKLREKWATYRPQFLEAVQLCRENGWRFRIVSERFFNEARVENVFFLRKYRDWGEDESIASSLLDTLGELQATTPSTLLETCFEDTELRMRAVGVVWRLVTEKRIGLDMDQLLNMETTIWSPK